jgi:Fe-S oxidoreductase
MSLEEYKAMMERCSNCLGCKWSPFDKVKSLRFGENCPSICYNNFNTYSARGRFQLALALVNKELPMTDTIVDVIHTCTSCGSCDVACKITRFNLEPLDHNIELKAEAVRQGKILPAQKRMMDALTKEKTMIPGKSKADRGKWLKDVKVKDVFKDKAEVLFSPAASSATTTNWGKSALAPQAPAQGGCRCRVMGSADMCCAGRAHQMGFNDEFARARRQHQGLREAGIKTFVTPARTATTPS